LLLPLLPLLWLPRGVRRRRWQLRRLQRRQRQWQRQWQRPWVSTCEPPLLPRAQR